jgi:hypothetical protein
MVKWLAISIFALFLVGEDERFVDWKPNQKLTWDDFQGLADAESEMKAHTQTKINVSWVCDDGDLEYTVQVRFDRQKSWKKELRTDRLLAHEQGHFDISEIYGRKMRKMLSELENACDLSTDEFKTQTGLVHKEWGDYQKQYDAETNHGIDHGMQDKWEASLVQQLTQLQSFASK